MTAQNNPHAARLHDSISKHCSTSAAEEFFKDRGLAKAPSPGKRRAWLCEALGALEKTVQPEVLRTIRQDCACGPAPGRISAVKKLRKAAATLEEFALLYNEAGLGSSVTVEAGALIYSYPRCYCSFVNDIDGFVPRSWCLCTTGWTARLFEGAFGVRAEVDLLESVKTGGSSCRMKVSFPDGVGFEKV